jgi:hypothetical protein
VRVPATVVVDVQNVYGMSAAVVGTPGKPTADGIAAALAPYGFDVDRVDAPIGIPASSDQGRVARALDEQAEVIKNVEQELASVGGPAGPQVAAARTALTAAAGHLVTTPPPGQLEQVLAGFLSSTGDAANKIRTAKKSLATARSVMSGGTVGASQVPHAWLVALDRLVGLQVRIGSVLESVESLSSYAWAGLNNLHHQSALSTFVGPPEVVVHPGRFRPGYNGRHPDEKQVDTLCAVACLERTREAVTAGASRAVILMSDDDDLTPALYAASRAAAAAPVRVIAAGSDVVGRRLQNRPHAPDRPRWVVLDQNAWHLAVGADPAAASSARHELARLACGDALSFQAGDRPGSVVTPRGLMASASAAVTAFPARLHLEQLRWRFGREQLSHVPRAVVGTRGPLSHPPGKVVQCPVAQGTHLAVNRLPVVGLPPGATCFHVDVPAPGWWMAGDEVIIASSQRGGRAAWRVLGSNTPRTGSDLAGAVRGRVVRLGQGASGPLWATVDLGGSRVSVLVNPGVALRVADEVVVVPYERRNTGRPARALLVSSAL